ncbi:lysophospholipid acyltransferase family protein [Paracoccus pacificus]|uniref:Lysophospholipid acyltransferase family protein n=1 Tax=Paracoccus pacificus TaxID=1463598 RepID=A0ABW4RAH1_9RHOB
MSRQTDRKTASPRADQTYHPGKVSPLTWLRTAMFYVDIALSTLVLGIGGLPSALFQRDGANRVATVWLGQMMRAIRWHLGIQVEVRGTPPTRDCIVASKHQSFLDILTLAYHCPHRIFIMKKEILRVPIMGWFAYRVGCIPIDRSRGSDAMALIVDEVRKRDASNSLGQLIIYPEGTRTRPGERRRYKHGVGVIYSQTDLPCVPVAVNMGLFWPKKGYPIRPGRPILEFLPEIATGLTEDAFMAQLTTQIETNSDRLMAEAGFRG